MLTITEAQTCNRQEMLPLVGTYPSRQALLDAILALAINLVDYAWTRDDNTVIITYHREGGAGESNFALTPTLAE